MGVRGIARVSLVRACAWRPVSGGFKVKSWDGVSLNEVKVSRHEYVAQVLWDMPPMALVTEDVFVGRSRLGSIRLSRYAQAVSSGLHIAWGEPVQERQILENVWRKHLKVGQSRKGKIDLVPTLMPKIVLGLSDVVSHIDGEPHIYDATALALLGIRLKAWEPGWVDLVKPKRRRGGRRT